jgi:hypothetical protein
MAYNTDLNFSKEIECIYKEKRYSVRNNGAVLRFPRDNNKPRLTDNKWIFGISDSKTGYMKIANERIHRIVATAFHGEAPTKEHIVDHIDTNRKNNRPENLRWITKLENALLNPITVKKIEIVCGCSIEEFIANPQKYRDLISNATTDIQWMRTVSKEESQECLKNLTNWTMTDKPLLGKALGDWIFRKKETYSDERIEEIFKQIENRTGICRQALCHHKAKRNEYYEARKYAAKQLRSELNLSDFEIGKLIGVSAITVNQYLFWYDMPL